jgi:hypothetical protein
MRFRDPLAEGADVPTGIFTTRTADMPFGGAAGKLHNRPYWRGNFFERVHGFWHDDQYVQGIGGVSVLHVFLSPGGAGHERPFLAGIVGSRLPAERGTRPDRGWLATILAVAQSNVGS